MDTSSSSRVTVEYHDPSGLFPSISQDLASRLPLRTLNWKSPTRPLRSIDALHVEFVPDTASTSERPSGADNARPQGPQRSVSTPIASQPTSAPQRARRHQFPGLRQTPYLKLYILRCDDKETYKTDSRKLLQNWVRDNTPSTQSTSALNKHDYHDACEWLILHVVVPDTPAAQEPRWTAASKKDPDELAERPQTTAKWPGKSTRTVLDKIRADFNSSSKSDPERVAQVRPKKDNVPAHLLPQSAAPGTFRETPQEQENAWQDLFAKFKTLILQSFDLRVSQYEDDIREKAAQRSLPGWNFCTFFTLKEGLARGFESAGLVEDAFAIYDELSAGLDAAVSDETSAADGRTTFLGDMSNVRGQLEKLARADVGPENDTVSTTTTDVLELFASPVDQNKKDYRSLIVSSTISLFEFHSYIFSRQLALLLRLSGLTTEGNLVESSKAQAAAPSHDGLISASEACKRAPAFIASNARVIRRALNPLSENSSPNFQSLVETVTSSWMYSVAEQVLHETSSPALPSSAPAEDAGSYVVENASTALRTPKPSRIPLAGLGANPYPTRKSSLLASPTLKEQGQTAQHAGGLQAQDNAATSGSGLAELAAGRAELFLLQRRIVESLAQRSGWTAGWAAIASARSFSEVQLDEEPATDEGQTRTMTSENIRTKGVFYAALQIALESTEAFQATFGHLNDLAVRHFIIASRTRSAETLLGDAALLKYQTGDYANAVQYFQKITPVYMQNRWSFIQAEMLRVYARCLKLLNRRDECVRVSLSLLGKIVDKGRSRQVPQLGVAGHRSTSGWLDEDEIDLDGYLPDLIQYSGGLPYVFTAPLTDFFGDPNVDVRVLHHPEKDGFKLKVSLRHYLDDEVVLDSVKTRLVNVDDSNQDVWLESASKITLRRGLVDVMVHSDVSTYSRFLIDRLVLEAGKLQFVHEFQKKPQVTPLGITDAEPADRKALMPGPSVMVYPRVGGFFASISLAADIHLDKTRNIVISLGSGLNDVQKIDVRLRPTTAGLRLHTADASGLDYETSKSDLSEAGTMKLTDLSPSSIVTISVPYSVENDVSNVSIRLEATLQAEAGTSTFHQAFSIPVDLPLDVDVSDTFKEAALFSRFSIRTINAVPLLVTSVALTDSSVYSVDSMPHPPMMPVLDKQPACLAYRIRVKDEKVVQTSRQQAALSLNVHYHCLDAIYLENISAEFETALRVSAFASFTRLLLPAFEHAIRNELSPVVLEEGLLVGQVRIPTSTAVGWQRHTASLDQRTQQALLEFLDAWHKSHATIDFNLADFNASTASNSTKRSVTISVPVPNIDTVFTAVIDLSTLDRPKAVSHIPPLARLGAPIQTNLKIRFTRRWSEARTLGGTEGDAETQEKATFVYEIRDAADTWLVGGSRRARFEASEGEEFVAQLLLIPIRTGVHSLPVVDVMPADLLGEEESGRGPSRGGVGDAAGRLPKTYETDYKSANEMVMVVGDESRSEVTILDSLGAQQESGIGDSMGRGSLESRLSKVAVS